MYMKPLTKRNDMIIKLFNEGYGCSLIVDKLVDAGFEKVSRTRVWSIIRCSPDYVRTNKVTRYCDGCQQEQPSEGIYWVKKGLLENKTKFRICSSCIKRIIPNAS